jgi:cold shock CspA family protein
VVGFVRSYGKYMREENITLNAVCPHVARTNISTGPFYDDLQGKGLLTPMEGIVDAFMHFVNHSDQSGECLEIGPVGTFRAREAPSVLNKESEDLNDLLYHRGHPLHEAVS